MRDFAVSPLPAWVERLWAEVGLAVVLGLVLATLGPFRTFESDPLQRMGFWIGLSAVWFVLVLVVDSLLDCSPLADRIGRGQRLVFKVALAALPMLFFVAAAVQTLFAFVPAIEKFAHLYLKTLLIGGGLTLISTALLSGPRRSIPAPLPGADLVSSPPVAVAGPALPIRAAAEPHALLERLPRHLHGPILCLQTEDHYVRVHTPHGSALVLMRMRDAIAMMGDDAGMRVHRCWWIARAAVQSWGRSGRTLRVELANGLVVPVSQPYAQATREALAGR
ncbi:LytTR family DNA-binding domain-containing protein [Sphingomonas sp. DT-207]|uniref:LytTR family DNA-binding domain-containing protein n=1 Tax=Sphingomonas sp. DT-207 TaxID=3396167 RepID=UPI003F1D898E